MNLGVTTEGGSISFRIRDNIADLAHWHRNPRLLSGLCILCRIALEFLEGGKTERAVELAALIWRYPIVASSHWFEDIAGQEIATAVENFSPEVVSTFQKQGRARDLWETTRELMNELKNPVEPHIAS